MTEYKKTDNIYVTYKTRMMSERIINKNNAILNALLVWYSFCLIAYSILNIADIDTIPAFPVSSIVCSVALFGLSVGRREKDAIERADQYRQCYLELQGLYNSPLVDDEKMKKYNEILHKFENQDDIHYDEMQFDAFLRGQDLYNSKGPLKMNPYVFSKVACIRLAKLSGYLGLFVAPIVIPIAINA